MLWQLTLLTAYWKAPSTALHMLQLAGLELPLQNPQWLLCALCAACGACPSLYTANQVFLSTPLAGSKLGSCGKNVKVFIITVNGVCGVLPICQGNITQITWLPPRFGRHDNFDHDWITCFQNSVLVKQINFIMLSRSKKCGKNGSMNPDHNFQPLLWLINCKLLGDLHLINKNFASWKHWSRKHVPVQFWTLETCSTLARLQQVHLAGGK